MERTMSQDIARTSFAALLSLGLITAVLFVSQPVLAITPEDFTPNVNDEPTNFPPSAEFRVTTNAGMTRNFEGTLGSTFYFDARQSNDPDGGLLKYRWDLDGDGQAETDWMTEPTITKTYFETGTKTIKLIVRDDVGQMDHYVKDIKIVKNTRPTAFFTLEPEQGSPAQEFRFDATQSFDDQYRETKLEYRWDFNGDNVYDTEWSRRQTVTHTYGYGYSGNQKVTLQVRDPENERHTYSRTLEILENTVPVAVIDIDPKVGTFNTIFSFDAGQSFDDETEFRELKFRWDTDYNGMNDIIYDSNFRRGGYRSSKRFDDDTQKVGNQKVRLEVQDEDGQIGVAIAEVNIHWASPYLDNLSDRNVIFTKYDRNFNPDTPVPRGEVVAMIMRMLDVNVRDISYQPYFSDVPAFDTNAEFIIEAYNRGIIEGYPDGTFRPEASISRAETLAMILRAFNIRTYRGGFAFYPDVPITSWFFRYVDSGTLHELVSGYENGNFGPHDPITFGEIAKMLFQADELKNAS